MFNKPGYLYVMRSHKRELTKVGYTRTPQLRLETVRRQEKDVSIELHQTWNGTMIDEQRLHSLFTPHRRYKREWYDLSASEAAGRIDAYLKTRDPEHSRLSMPLFSVEDLQQIVFDCLTEDSDEGSGWTTDQLIKAIRQSVARTGSQHVWAHAVGVTMACVNDVLNGRREPGPKLLNSLGLERNEPTYRKKSRGKKQ